jgi:hypothetical protein
VFIALGIYHWNYLFIFPRWFVDEALTASRVRALDVWGTPAGVIEREAAFGEKNGALFVPALPYLVFLVPLKLFPSLEIVESLRISSYVGGMALLGAVGVIAWRFISPLYGAIAMGICGSSSAFSYCSHVARPDVLAAAVGFLGLAVYGARPMAAFLSFFLATFSIAFHQRGIILVISLMAAMLVDVVSRKFSRRSFFMAVVGGLMGIAGFYLINIFLFSSLDALWEMNRRVFAFTPPPVAGAGASDWRGILSTLTLTSLFCYPSVGLCILLSIVFLSLAGATRVNRRLSVMIVTGLLAGALLMNGLVVVKLVMVSPLLDLAVTGCLAVACSLAVRNSRWAIPTLAMSAWFIMGITFGGVWLVVTSVSKCKEDAPRIATALQSFIPVSAKVLAEESFWIYLQNNRYQSWKDLPSRMLKTGQSFSQAVKSTESDYLIVDDGMIAHVNANMSDPFFRSLGVSPREFMIFLESDAAKVGEISTACYGTLTLYALHKIMLG